MNKVILMGRLTRDPEIRYTSVNNTPVCSFTLAVERRFSKQGEPRQADFINIVAWDKQAEFCGKWFEKGQRVAVIGRIQTRTWDDNEGKKRYVTEVVAEECYFADSRKSEGGSGFNYPSDAGGENQDDGFYPLDGDDELPF